jgi:hypothetical protein
MAAANGFVGTFDRRLVKLEMSILGKHRPYGDVVRFIVQEDEDADQIISNKRKSGEIKPDTLVIVRKIVGPSVLSASELSSVGKRVPTRFNS